VNATGNRGMTPLFQASRRGHLEIVEVLLAAKADAKKRTDEGKTASMIALEEGHFEVVQLLSASSHPQGASLRGEDLDSPAGQGGIHE
jgi:serine/threonine-protein phosphatase 6 regulatory ankyrin repeat subunit B